MKVDLTNGRLTVRFTINFIVHQILLWLLMGIPGIYWMLVLQHQSQNETEIAILAWVTIFIGLSYCLFYGYYVARPLVDILMNIQKLSRGEYLDLPGKRIRLSFFSKRLYREVYDNLKTLSDILQHNEKKRKEFDEMRRTWAAGITHDLKTPLSYISGYADMLLSDKHKWSLEEKKEFLQIISDKSAHIEELINDLGTAFRMDEFTGLKMNLQKIELSELVRRVTAETANMPIAKENHFEMIGEEKELFVSGDTELLKRAFSNLLVNAVVHNPEDTSVTVKLSRESYVEVEICDNGSGMNEYDINHMFDRYYRGTSTDSPTGSTGLGMTIVKQIITAHHGTISVKSKINCGTKIIVRLPPYSEAK
ncbi:Alkaline phosphatase synthesis sensor protein PhoR [Clostridium luticellarii]|jgi:signal transduction histidine kinase|uniref:histidine kinase n=2 Tax=Clostridium luticellarii TaxID=1691940 RepID=A0A2T0BLG5_9CLOT|nr:Alkaline phosphatase synthesis sensor protein PhoR [Clostridium luticellarii]